MGAINAKPARQKSRPGRHPRRLIGQGHGAEQHAIGPVVAIRHHIDAVVNAIAHIHIKPPRLTKQGFVTGGAAAVAVAGGVGLAIRLRFHNHAPNQLASGLAFQQQAADELRCHDLSRAREEGLGEGWEGLGGYGSGLELRATLGPIRLDR